MASVIHPSRPPSLVDVCTPSRPNQDRRHGPTLSPGALGGHRLEPITGPRHHGAGRPARPLIDSDAAAKRESGRTLPDRVHPFAAP